ncbi:hypothetical protein JR316_0004583 [Psilocybe cubensis]|uniref:Uncharacterized protein n=2 Tax=Psilocybe cubensis TaxID=181762 RepID=A0ACB8H3L1_PSICU|nr:hypothetical protein JR316_0004583 [Psilocybe cubensis]KAH9482483.1 hypothetical protein JR316_0004583 [Psilocybe cubensis]
MSSLKYFTKKSVLSAATQSSVTTHFNHLRPIPRAWVIRRSKYDPKIKSVRPADRIKWWNIAPGDQIRLRGDPESIIHEVLSINRLSNRVFLKNTVEESSAEGQPPKSKNYHYSRCQLYLGEFEVPTPDDPSGLLSFQHVFALRIGTTQPYWDYRLHRYVWKRYAVKTVPKLQPSEYGKKIFIPWPKKPERKYPEAGLYDTLAEDVAKITYKLPHFNPDKLEPLPPIPSEAEYLDHIYNPHRTPYYDPSAPFEVYLQPDLANPHSRAKKLERWKQYQAGIHNLLKKITAYELANLDGRTVKQARSDAAFKWREQVKEEQAKKKKARWMHSAQMLKWERKNAKKEKKEDRQRRRLTELMLEDEPNQVIPKALAVKKAKQTKQGLKA